jgi:hypothetical protein
MSAKHDSVIDLFPLFNEQRAVLKQGLCDG